MNWQRHVLRVHIRNSSRNLKGKTLSYLTTSGCSLLLRMHALLTMLEDRYEKKSLVITSQLPLERWYDYIAEPTLSDAIMDRLVNSSEHIELKGETMRHKRKGK